MEWSPTSAANAYLDTLKLCNDYKIRCDCWRTLEPESNEFISALAAGMRAKLIVEVSPGVSPSTIALAAAARQTGGRLVCILPEQGLVESKRIIKDSGLKDIVEFKAGDPSELLSHYGNIDFSLVDCKNDDYESLLKLIDVNPERSVVVANNLVSDKRGLQGMVKGMERVEVRSMKRPIGRGMEITMIGKTNNNMEKMRESSLKAKRVDRVDIKRKTCKSNWVVKVDEESGEEHIFRVPKYT